MSDSSIGIESKDARQTPDGAAPGEDAAAKRSVAGATPMIAQYIEIKAANPDSLLFYRMGDFFELFFEDAETASRALGITLTSRGTYRGHDIPMCGVPVRAADDYLQRLIRLGFRVAVCEQLEDPAEAKKRGAKAVVRRDVTRLVTAGTLTEESLLDARRSNFLVALACTGGGDGAGGADWALAWLELSTGEFQIAPCPFERLESELHRLDPGEVLVSEQIHGGEGLKALWPSLRGAVTPLPREMFDSTASERRLRAYFDIAALEAYGDFSRPELAAAGAVIAYVEMTQAGQKPAVSPPSRLAPGAIMAIDPATRANLELARTLRGEAEGSLLSAIDRTVTPAGARALAERLAGPLTDPAAINARLDAAGYFLEAAGLRQAIRKRLRASADLARALSRLSLGRGGPRDLAAIGAGLDTARDAAQLISEGGDLAPLPQEIQHIAGALGGVGDTLRTQLAEALGEELPAMVRDGGFVRAGYRADLDEARALRDESRKVIASLQARYAEDSEIKSLKVRHNNVLGYFIEVGTQHGARLMAPPLNQQFIHRQTLASAVRFTTVELGELEAAIAAAADRALAIEASVFEDLRDGVLGAAAPIQAAAGALAALDVHAALGELAETEAYTRPRVDASLAFCIKAGRHPVVEQALARSGETFIGNDCDLGPRDREDQGGGKENGEDAGRLWLVTGPNMAGKSTFLRQNALIAILAQIGAFVPAEYAHIGVVDRLFSRVGAADDLARGRSTFMVEMVETAAILNQAGPRSLVIVDEIGRGTATFDGLSIAWGAVEHLLDINRSRTLFATHFHELTRIADSRPRVHNATVRVKEWDGKVVFLHEVVAGAADRSYGIQVARLAGLPPGVLTRARQVLDILESSETGTAGARLADDLPLFTSATAKPVKPPSPAITPAMQEVLDIITAAAPDDMSAKQALDLLYSIKLKLAGDP